MAANSHAELQSRFEDFLHEERFGQVDRIASAIDDYVRRGRGGGDGGGGPSGPSSSAMSTAGGDAVGWGCPRVRISLGDLRSFDPRAANRLRLDPLRHIRALEAACHAVASEERPGYDKDGTRVKIALAGPLGAAPSSPRSLTSSSLSQLVCVEGVATKVSASRPKLVQSTHFCPTTKAFQDRDYRDSTDPELGLPPIDESGREMADRVVTVTNTVYPTKDKDQNPLETEYGLSRYKDHQTVSLQEMPERAPMGQLPRSVELILEHDLVDRIKPGDRVQIVGVYRALASSGSVQSTSGMFRTVVLVNNVQIMGRDVSNLTFSAADVREIRTLGKRKDILSILGRSVAPSIHGHEMIKRALALQLLSGCERNLENGTHLRGDINVLMVGDPSTAKSQLLRASMQIAPLAVSTTGKGSSGVGLTAAVTSDPDTRERRLEAGAMVLADRGLVCVDEFDKMSEADRVAIHEAMEQQTVTIAKAGIHASLNARCSVLAAANPVYGQYDRRRRPQENIGLPDSLLSRFDLLFVVLDQLDPSTDRRIAAHVLRGHRYRRPGAGLGPELPSSLQGNDDGSDSEDEAPSAGRRNTAVWQRCQHRFTTRSTQEEDDPHSEDVLSQEFLRKYLHFAKTRMKPVLTEDARESIASRYAEMRSRQDERTLPVTARSLETIIRLASAHAKARLSPLVEAEPDCSTAMDILGFALYHEDNDAMRTADDGGFETENNVGASTKDQSSAPPPKRARVDSKSVSESERSRQIDQAKVQIWEELNEMDGSLDVADLTLDVEQDILKVAIQQLVDESRIMESEGALIVL